MPFAAILMGVEIVMSSKSGREREISYDIPYMWNPKQEMIQVNLLTNKNETQTQKRNLRLPGGKG